MPAGHAVAWILSGPDVNGRRSLWTQAALLSIPLFAVLTTRPTLTLALTPHWTFLGAFLGWCSWRLAHLHQSGAPSRPDWRDLIARLPPLAFIVIAEEIIWRGYLVPRLGILLAALAFSLHHAYFGWRPMLGIAVLGLIWGGLLVASGSFVPPLVSHLVYTSLVLSRDRLTTPAEEKSPAADR